MRVFMSGGGTAGHVYPALTVAAELADEHDVTFIGTPNGLEARLVPEAGVRFRGLPSRGFDRARPLSLLTAVVVMAFSAIKAWRWFGAERPDVVIGFGGYVSLPVGLAAVARKIPLVLHEQNSVPGLANRVLSRWASAAGVTYEESAPLLFRTRAVEVTGNPVRPEVLASSRVTGRARLGVRDEDLVLLVFGGSRGARHLNQAIARLKHRLMAVDGLVVIHVTGPSELESVRGLLGDVDTHRWHTHAYLDGMGDVIAASDLVVCRAGATTIAELTALGAPSILVPYPYATDDHQTKNAVTLVEHGAAIAIADSELDDAGFGDEIVALLGDGKRRANMAAASRSLARTDAADRVATLAVRAAARRGSRSSRQEKSK